MIRMSRQGHLENKKITLELRKNEHLKNDKRFS